jgi:hypothetical protein
MKKYEGINKIKPKSEVPMNQDEDMDFSIWKAELNKELMAFWKSIKN